MDAGESRASYEPSDDRSERQPLDLGEGRERAALRQDPDAPANGVLDPTSEDPPEPNEPA